MVSEHSDLAGKEQVSPSDLADRPLLFTRRDLIKQELLHWFGKVCRSAAYRCQRESSV